MTTRARTTRTTIDGSSAQERSSGPALLIMSPDMFASLPLFSPATIVIGRSTECDLRLEDPLVSRRHARLYVSDAPAIEDLRSANGTRVRDAVIEPGVRVPVSPGEAIAVGSTVLIVQAGGPVAGARRIWSHASFETRLRNECGRAEGGGSRFALVRVRFERAISWTRVVPLLARDLPQQHLFATYGPNEFELLLLETTAEEATRLLEALGGSLASLGTPVRLATAWYPRDGRSADALLARANALLRAPDAQPEGDSGFEASAPAMKRVFELASRAARSNISVLLVGETGVGKEVVAQTVHRLSSRAGKPLVALNCAGLSETLIEAELFGHEKGAFTGATQAQVGLLEAANEGTVFLDEIGEMPAAIQAKVLRVIETREVLPVGARKARSIDVRFIAATNRNLEAEIEAGKFRRDLFYRLNGITIAIPPLRERVVEIQPLARRFLEGASRASGRDQTPTLHPDAAVALERYHWPGNVRELKNVIERALVLCDGPAIGLEHLPDDKLPRPPEAAGPSPVASRPLSDEEHAEKLRMMAALNSCAWNQSRAAELLSMSRRTFVDKLLRYGIPRPNRGRRTPVAESDGNT